MAGREWQWRLQISTTSDPQVARADVEVTTGEKTERVLARLSGYLEMGE